MEGAARTHLAVFLANAGDLERAEQEARSAIELLRLAAVPLLPRALAALSNALLGQGRTAEALIVARDARVPLEGPVEEGNAFVRLVHAEALEASGDRHGARAEIADAKTRLLDRAAKISNAEIRKGFLERVPEHARTLALAHEWLHD